MLILGLLLVVLSGAAAAVLIAYNGAGTAMTVSVFGRDIADITLMQAFVAGIAVALVFLLGVWMVVSAGRRGREQRARYRDARREAKTAAKERDELADRIRKEDEVRAEQDTVAMPVAPAGEQTVVTKKDDSGRHAAQATDRHKQPVITNIHEDQSPAK
jgi:ABC-type nickel/cobalt efflux system permease component RcnA